MSERTCEQGCLARRARLISSYVVMNLVFLFGQKFKRVKPSKYDLTSSLEIAAHAKTRTHLRASDKSDKIDVTVN